jgi:hypothetical protein
MIRKKGPQAAISSSPKEPPSNQLIPSDVSQVSKNLLWNTNTNSVQNYILNHKIAAGITQSLGARGIFCLQPSLPNVLDNGRPRKIGLIAAEKNGCAIIA